MIRVAFLPGSFDPMTNGHVGVLETALALADRVVLAVGIHPRKMPMFSHDERVAMLREVVATLAGNAKGRVDVIHYEGLMIDAARAAGATVLLRGVRDGTDFDAEMRMAAMNTMLAPELPTVFVPAAPAHRHISATLARQIAEMKGDLSGFVPAAVARRLAARS